MEYNTNKLWYLDFSNPKNPIWNDLGKQGSLSWFLSNNKFMFLEWIPDLGPSTIWHLDFSNQSNPIWTNLSGDIKVFSFYKMSDTLFLVWGRDSNKIYKLEIKN
ncbi:hypothetical protein [Spiroplasma endosymbiont of 'Nebria riversi']|uniref:hypothetical protein n=1 Tax=Spiroplasma endosymbiont of 'Nebria riversi' TaxID=2792084 RepID=UPI001C03D88C|nr:hypothetical protein [Spiroplasma endosymbiont of 'Nebria riversi']